MPSKKSETSLKKSWTELEYINFMKDYYKKVAEQTAIFEKLCQAMDVISQKLYTKDDSDRLKQQIYEKFEPILNRQDKTVDEVIKKLSEVEFNLLHKIESLCESVLKITGQLHSYYELTKQLMEEFKNQQDFDRKMIEQKTIHERQIQSQKMQSRAKLIGQIVAAVLGSGGIIYTVISVLGGGS